MPVQRLENAKRILLATILTGLCWALPGCQSITPTTTYAEIRFIDASPDAPGLDVYEGTTAIVYNMGFSTVTSYVPISPGSYHFAAKTAGSSQTLVTTTGSVSTSHQYTVMFSNSVAVGLQETIFTDQSQPAPTGQIAFRIIDEAIQSPAGFDVYMVPSGAKLSTVNPIQQGVVFGGITSYINVPSGSYSVEIVPAGTVLTSTTVATYSGAVTAYTAGSAHSFIILDQQILNTPGAQVITTDDYESPGAVATN